jgi:hypothetical protein
VEPVVEGAMQTPDGLWRIVHGDNVMDWLPIAAVQQILADAGVDMGGLIAAA